MRRNLYLIVVLFSIVSVLLAACGGGRQTSSTAQPTQKVASQPTTVPHATATTVVVTPTATPSPTSTAEGPKTTAIVPTATLKATLRKEAQHAQPAGKPAKQPTKTPSPKPAPSPTPKATPVVTQMPGQPARFTVNTSGVKINAAVEYVGQTSDGAMDVPKKWEDVAWYKLGYLPGQEGNAVIAGHFDSTTGPAVFWKLDNLKIGDIVSVVDRNGKKLDFRVTKKAVYYNNDAPLTQIFGPADTANLNLITCDGLWNPDKKEYDRKLVVFTTLVTDKSH